MTSAWDYVEKFASIGQVSVDKNKVTFTVTEGEADDKFTFTLTGNRATLMDSVKEIVNYLVKANNLTETVLAALPETGFECKSVELPQGVPPSPVFNREDFANDPGFESIHEGGIDLKPAVVVSPPSQDQVYAMKLGDSQKPGVGNLLDKGMTGVTGIDFPG